jgi:hypothetical protein
LPARHALDPTQFHNVLANVWLLDVVGERPRFRVRLLGERIRSFGVPAKVGDFLDEHLPSSDQLADLREVVRTGEPSWFRGKPHLSHAREVIEIERVLLPLAADGSTVDVIFAVTVSYPASGEGI